MSLTHDFDYYRLNSYSHRRDESIEGPSITIILRNLTMLRKPVNTFRRETKSKRHEAPLNSNLVKSIVEIELKKILKLIIKYFSILFFLKNINFGFPNYQNNQ